MFEREDAHSEAPRFEWTPPMFMFSSLSRPHLARGGMLAVALLVISGALLASSAAPASAARSIAQSPGFYCENALVKVSPPRVWASGAQPEQVLWRIGIQRWDAGQQRWFSYKTTDHYSTFNYYGQSLTSWSGGQFVNSRLNVPVYHQGFYRVASTVAAPGGSSAVLVGGGQYCQVW